MESKEAELIETETRFMVPGAEQWGKRGDVGQRIQTSSYKMNKFWGIILHYIILESF